MNPPEKRPPAPPLTSLLLPNLEHDPHSPEAPPVHHAHHLDSRHVSRRPHTHKCTNADTCRSMQLVLLLPGGCDQQAPRTPRRLGTAGSRRCTALFFAKLKPISCVYALPPCVPERLDGHEAAHCLLARCMCRCHHLTVRGMRPCMQATPFVPDALLLKYARIQLCGTCTQVNQARDMLQSNSMFARVTKFVAYDIKTSSKVRDTAMIHPHSHDS